jgi:hypothetical protein
MKTTSIKLTLGASILTGLSAFSMVPAFAATFNGTASGPYRLFGSTGTTTFLEEENFSLTASKDVTLTGDSSAPGNNLQLSGLPAPQKSFANFTQATTLTGTVNSKSIALSSLTAEDWCSSASEITSACYTPGTLAYTWFNQALVANGGILQAFVMSVFGGDAGLAFNAFNAASGFQRLSDANIAYVNGDSSGKVTFGLAGFFETSEFPAPFTNLLASEVVKVTYDGKTDFFYMFDNPGPTSSGQAFEGDGESHTGNYEFEIPGQSSGKVPEPSAVLGLLATGGLLVASKRRSAKQG